MKKLLYMVVFLYGFSNAQNLIQNGNFEEYYSCPQFLGDFTPKFWYSPTDNTPNYFNSCSPDLTTGMPANFYGFQYSFSGQAHIGASNTHSSASSREYFTNHLLQLLEKDTIYCLSFYINTPERDTIGVLYDNIGVYFSNDSIFYSIFDTLPFIPQLETLENVFYNDTVNWIKVEFEYKAAGGEEYMTIGNFKSNKNTDTLKLGPSTQNYYYFDDFSLVKCNPPTQPMEIIIPNVFTPNGDGANDVFQIEILPANSNLAIYNRWGNNVYQSDNYQNNWDGENHTEGVYYYIFTLPNGNAKKGTVTLLR